ncbi:MAG: nucleoside hydrolase [Acidimicrobiia bacterium]|nr:nucleoside hydrolase [Acidimicrobiia bacterium]
MPPRARVISDNDYCGDPDGLVQLAHHLLCPSVDIRAVVGSPPAPRDPAADGTPAVASVAAARVVADLAGRADVPILAGADEGLIDPMQPRSSEGAAAIVSEAMRDDTDVPLFVACGGGLTSIASAWLTEPAIAARLTLVWIGGREHPDLAVPADEELGLEYNASIDPVAAEVVFNRSDLRLWQIPRDVYRQVLASRSELLVRMAPHGELGRHLFDALARTTDLLNGWGVHMGETYILGDSPLVLLTALLSNFHPAPSSSRWVDRPRPRLSADGSYEPTDDGPPMRIFTQLDTRLVLEDLDAKLALR